MVRINEKIIKNIKSYGIQSQQLGTAILVLDCLDRGKYNILDSLDDENKERQMLSLYRDLQRKELIDRVDEGISNYYITEKGRSLIDYIKVEIESIPETEEKIEEKLGEVVEYIEDWISDYIALFPDGMTHGKRLRESTARVLPRMKDFLESYPFSKKIVFEATKEYLDKEGNSEYTRNCFYFIYKKDKVKGWISDLLAYCENISRRENQEALPNFDTI